MARAAEIAAHDPRGVLRATAHRTVALDDEAACDEAITWWTEECARGGEGMVVKPAQFVVHHKERLIQPAVKCRGREYLRIIYGPHYTEPDELQRLRQRGLGRKRGLALREFALGIEGLHRFTARQPLRAVHECAFGVLAMETEPVDPRALARDRPPANTRWRAIDESMWSANR